MNHVMKLKFQTEIFRFYWNFCGGKSRNLQKLKRLTTGGRLSKRIAVKLEIGLWRFKTRFAFPDKTEKTTIWNVFISFDVRGSGVKEIFLLFFFVFRRTFCTVFCPMCQKVNVIIAYFQVVTSSPLQTKSCTQFIIKFFRFRKVPQRRALLPEMHISTNYPSLGIMQN